LFSFGILKKLIFLICLSQFAHFILAEPNGIEFSDDEVMDTIAFWTQERIERALSTPLPNLLNNEKAQPAPKSCPWNPPPLTKLTGNYSQLYPWIGKLLIYRGKTEFSCSASIVRSKGGKMLASAGHCILDENGKVYERPMFYLQFGPNYNRSWPINGAWWEKCFAAKTTQIPNVWDYTWLRTRDAILPFASGGLIYPNDINADLVLTEYGYPGTGGGYLYECHAKMCDHDFPIFPPCKISGTDMSFTLGCEGLKFNHGMSGGPVIGGTKPNLLIAGVMSNIHGDLGFEKQYWTFLGSSARAAYNEAVANGA